MTTTDTEVTGASSSDELVTPETHARLDRCAARVEAMIRQNEVLFARLDEGF